MTARTPYEEQRAWIEVDLSAIRANVGILRDGVGPERGLMAVVKADGYGHGMIPVAQAALQAGADWLGVATVGEGVCLREAGVTKPIALICPCLPDDAPAILDADLTPMVGDLPFAQALALAVQARPSHRNLNSPPRVHLDIDTGIGRAGVAGEQAVELWQALRAMGLVVTGLATHYADADSDDPTMRAKQTARFAQTHARLCAAGARFDWIHVSASAALLHSPVPFANLARPGMLLYGLRPVAPAPPPGLRAALTLKARVATVRDLPTGQPISYGMTHVLRRPSQVATLLIGYGDGYPRRLSNQGHVLLNGRRAPILGRVCMDQTVVDVTDIPGVHPGDVGVCIGAQGDDRITVEEIAARIETTEHEIPVCLTARLPRRYSNTNFAAGCGG